MNLSTFANEYKRPELRSVTTRGHRAALLSLLGCVGGRIALADIRHAQVVKCVEGMHAQGLRKSTIAKNVRYLHAAFAYAKRLEYVTVNPVDGVKVTQKFAPKAWDYVSSDQAKQVIDSIGDVEIQRLLGLCRWAGCRANEAMRMKYSQIDFARKTITITPTPDDWGRLEEGTKGKLRLVPLDPRLAALIGRGEPDEFVCGRLYYRRAQKLSAMVTWQGAPTHTLRKSCGMDWADKVPISTVADWMGHSVLVASKYYLRPSDQHFATITECPLDRTLGV